MHTESQALSLWCPMVRLSPLPPGNPNLAYLQPTTRGIEVQHGNCIGSRCAMWRWADETKRRIHWASVQGAHTEEEAGTKPDLCEGWEFRPAEDDPACWVEPEDRAMARSRGYCGLAGKPEVAP